VEAATNDIVWRDLPIEAREHTPDELAGLPLRKGAVKGSRVVVVAAPVPGAGQRDPGAGRGAAGPGAGDPDHAVILDASPCGGTHPRRTGEVGAVAVLRAQKWGAGTRVEFVCGGRVIRALREGADRVAEASAALRCAPAELPAAAVRAADEAAARRKELEVLLAAVAASVADRLADGPPGPVASRLEVPLSTPAGLRATAQALAARGRVALLGSVDGGRAHLCFARPRGPGRDLGAALRTAAAALGGKGGGTPDLAQGSGPDVGALGRALDSARESVEDPEA
jgi:alanyl-tRNA synthetase